MRAENRCLSSNCGLSPGAGPRAGAATEPGRLLEWEALRGACPSGDEGDEGGCGGSECDHVQRLQAMKRGPLLVMLLLLPRSSLPLSPASSSSTAFLSSFQPLGGLRVPVQQATWGRAGVGISLKEGRRQGCGPWPRARPINALHTSRRMANGVSVESHLYSVWEANVSVSPRQSLDSSLSMLERHLASMQLQLEWLHADSRYALCLALAMQLSSSNQSFFSSDIAASAAQIRQMIDRANHNSNRVRCEGSWTPVLMLMRLVCRTGVSRAIWFLTCSKLLESYQGKVRTSGRQSRARA
eukprot:271815-Hanusia_phi.AAC.4